MSIHGHARAGIALNRSKSSEGYDKNSLQPAPDSAKICSGNWRVTMMKGICAVLLGASLAAAMMGSPTASARSSVIRVSGSTPSDDSDLRLPDPHKELQHLSKDLKLKRDQRAGVNIILQERSREIRLLLDIDTLSQEYRDRLAQKVMEESDAQIETLLRNKQRIKFDKELAKDRDTR